VQALAHPFLADLAQSHAARPTPADRTPPIHLRFEDRLLTADALRGAHRRPLQQRPASLRVHLRGGMLAGVGR
jgi:hypothetical protein